MICNKKPEPTFTSPLRLSIQAKGLQMAAVCMYPCCTSSMYLISVHHQCTSSMHLINVPHQCTDRHRRQQSLVSVLPSSYAVSQTSVRLDSHAGKRRGEQGVTSNRFKPPLNPLAVKPVARAPGGQATVVAGPAVFPACRK